MTKRILFFTEGVTATTAEKAAIAKLNAAAEKPYEVTVLNGAANAKYGETDRVVPADFVAGTIPDVYYVDGDPDKDPVYPVIDPDNIPAQTLAPTQAVVSDGETFEVDGGTIAVAVEDGVPTFTFEASAG